MSKTVTLRPSDAILNALNELAAKENRSVNYLVNEALRHYLKIDANKPIEHTKQTEPIQIIPKPQSVLKSPVIKETIAQQVERIRLEKLAKRNAMPSAEPQPIDTLGTIDTSELNESF